MQLWIGLSSAKWTLFCDTLTIYSITDDFSIGIRYYLLLPPSLRPINSYVYLSLQLQLGQPTLDRRPIAVWLRWTWRNGQPIYWVTYSKTLPLLRHRPFPGSLHRLSGVFLCNRGIVNTPRTGSSLDLLWVGGETSSRHIRDTLAGDRFLCGTLDYAYMVADRKRAHDL